MSDKAPALATADEAKALIGGEAEYAAAVLAGELRRVKHGGEVFVLGSDIDRLCRERAPSVTAGVPGGGSGSVWILKDMLYSPRLPSAGSYTMSTCSSMVIKRERA